MKEQFEMNGSRQVEIHYINTGFPYTIIESFMDLFEGLSYAQADMFLTEAPNDQVSPYWSPVHTNSYKYGFSGSVGSSSCSLSQLHHLADFCPRLDGGRRTWESPITSTYLHLPQLVSLEPGEEAEASANPERIQANNQSSSPQRHLWQDDFDPAYMRYEELLELGESVGMQSRGLAKEHISSLPVTKYKCSFFSRLKKKQRERCVICQMDYRRGDQQITLPCKHVYHCVCVSRWLSINKVCLKLCSAHNFHMT